MTRSRLSESWMDGRPITVIEDGLYKLDSLKHLNMSSSELFMELRQQGVEHLGQVRLAILETDGDVSLFFFGQQEVRPGMSVLPPLHRRVMREASADGLYCCTRCGLSRRLSRGEEAQCARCDCNIWTEALTNPRVQ